MGLVLKYMHADMLPLFFTLMICSPLPVLLPAGSGQGLQISAQLVRQDGQIFYSLLFENSTQITLDGFMIQFNKNSFGLAAAGPLQVITTCVVFTFYLACRCISRI